MQYDIDIISEHAQNFKMIRTTLLSYPNIREIKNEKQTSYSDEYGVVIMLRTNVNHLVVAFARGSKLQEKFPQLQGNGKVVRHLYIKNGDTLDEKLLREMIEESFVLGVEAYELKLLRNQNSH